MEFLQTPDHNRRAADQIAVTPAVVAPGSINVGGGNVSASVPWTNLMTPALTKSGTSLANKIPEGSRQDIKNSFRALFSPGAGASPSPLLSTTYPYYPSITPYIAPSHSLEATESGTATANDDGKKLQDGPVDRSVAMSSSGLRRAAKEAVVKEFMNMPSFAAGVDHPSPGMSSASVEQTVPESGDGKQISSEHGVPALDPKLTGNRAKYGGANDKASTTAPDANTKNVPKPNMFPVYPVNLQGFTHPPSGMRPVHPVGYPMPMVFPTHAPSHMVGACMPLSRTAPVKDPIKANETPEERKARIELEKQELVREFKKKTREAALVRFRQKRRERKFGKLIRYDCRKKLADARPRVKGRFVRVKDVVRHDDDTQVVPGVK